MPLAVEDGLLHPTPRPPVIEDNTFVWGMDDDLGQLWTSLELGLFLLLFSERLLHFPLLAEHQLVPQLQPHQQCAVGPVVAEQLCVGLRFELLHPEFSLMTVSAFLVQTLPHNSCCSKSGQFHRSIRTEFMKGLTTKADWTTWVESCSLFQYMKIPVGVLPRSCCVVPRSLLTDSAMRR